MNTKRMESKLTSILDYKRASKGIHKLFLENYYVGVGILNELIKVADPEHPRGGYEPIWT